MKKLLFIAIASLITITALAVQNEIVEKEFIVSGNCSMCKERIENTMKIKEVKFAKWNKKTKMLKVAFINSKMTVDSLQHRLAVIGHDTEKYKADDKVYSALPKCCLYRDNNSTH